MKYTITFIVLSMLLLSGCTHKKGNEQENASGLRIVSLAASISDELVELGLKKHIVGATSYCNVAKENKNLVVGSAIETNEEKIILLKPDIVCATTLTKQSTIDILKKNNINIFVYNKANSFNAIAENYLNLGEKTGKEELARAIVEKARTKIDSLTKLIPKQDKKLKILFQLGSNPIVTVIPDTYLDELIRLSGGMNLFYDMNKYLVGRESVLLRNPDVIFITTMGISGNEEKNNWQQYKDISAVKNDKVFLIDAGTASRPTATNFVKTLEIMIKNIYF